MAAPPPQPAAAAPAAARADPRVPRRAAVRRAPRRALRATSCWSSTPRPQMAGDGRHAEPAGGRQGRRGRRAQGPAGGRQGQRDRGRPHGPGRRQRHDRHGRVRQAIAEHQPTRRHRQPRRRAAAGVGPRGALGRRRDPRGDGRGAGDAAERGPRGADPRPARRPRRQQPGDRRARGQDRARRAVAQRVRLEWRTSGSSWSSGGSRCSPTGGCGRLGTLRLDPQPRTDVSIDDIDDPDHPASVVEVRLVGPDGATTPADALGVDDRAWAVVPPERQRRCCWPATATRTSRPRSLPARHRALPATATSGRR